MAKRRSRRRQSDSSPIIILVVVIIAALVVIAFARLIAIGLGVALLLIIAWFGYRFWRRRQASASVASSTPTSGVPYPHSDGREARGFRASDPDDFDHDDFDDDFDDEVPADLREREVDPDVQLVGQVVSDGTGTGTWAAQEVILHRLHYMTPARFEQTIAALLRLRGFSNVDIVGGPGDLAVDITCVDAVGKRVGVQCKRYSPDHPVRSKDVQLFIGMAFTEHMLDRGIYVTTSTFTADARELAGRHRIELIAGLTLTSVLIGEDDPCQLDSGAEEDPAALTEADADYLRELGIQPDGEEGAKDGGDPEQEGAAEPAADDPGGGEETTP